MYYLIFRRGVLNRISKSGLYIPFLESRLPVPEKYKYRVGAKTIHYSIIDPEKAIISISSHKVFMRLFYFAYYKQHRKTANEVLKDFGLRIDKITNGRKRPNPQV